MSLFYKSETDLENLLMIRLDDLITVPFTDITFQQENSDGSYVSKCIVLC